MEENIINVGFKKEELLFTATAVTVVNGLMKALKEKGENPSKLGLPFMAIDHVLGQCDAEIINLKIQKALLEDQMRSLGLGK